MDKIILLIILAIGLIFGLFWAFRFYNGKKYLVKSFSDGNCIVFGLKGCGKDLIFNKVINSRNINCYANIPYNKELCIVKDIKDFSVNPNTFENILDNNIKLIPKLNKENCDFYISDGGIFLPSQYSNRLIKDYPSLPIYYALNRHLTNSNIHINSQYLGRVWDKLREHAAYYIMAVKTHKIGNYLITKYRLYDNYQSASAKIRPYKISGLITHSESRANKEDFESKHGLVKNLYIIQNKNKVYYDSRYFHKAFYGTNSPDSI
mgnify:CR=1 FL=1